MMQEMIVDLRRDKFPATPDYLLLMMQEMIVDFRRDKFPATIDYKWLYCRTGNLI